MGKRRRLEKRLIGIKSPTPINSGHLFYCIQAEGARVDTYLKYFNTKRTRRSPEPRYRGFK